jgi:uncharacterized protein YdeI (YjbR/CyaY-like superfamily)
MKNPAVDVYIAKSADFARPILMRLRALMHKACPTVEETIKWGMPHFEYQGVIAGMAAFKQHAAFWFWKQRLMKDPAGFLSKGGPGMGWRKIRSLDELPSDTVLLGYIHEAVALNEQGATVPRSTRKKPPVRVPPYLTAALKKNAKARRTFGNLSASQRREYVEWLTGAKQETTRERRLATAIGWMAEGKARNWKYQNC